MSTSPGTMDYLLDQLSEAGPVTARRMFGEYCLYYAGRPVGLVCDEQLYLKPTQEGERVMGEVIKGAPFPKAKLHLLVSADRWEERQWLGNLVRTTAHALPPPKPPKSPKTAKKPVATKRSAKNSPE